MASGSYFEVEARVVSPGVVAKVAALIEEPARLIERRLQESVRRGLESGDAAGQGRRVGIEFSTEFARETKRRMEEAIRDALKGTGTNPGRQGQQSGQSYADAFSREVKAKLEAAFRSLPDAPLSLNSSAADVEIAEIRAKLKAATSDLELGVDTTVVDARVAALQARLEVLASNNPDIRVRVNTSAALAQIEAFRLALKGESKKAGDDAGKETADAFTRQMRTRLTAAFESLPKLKIDANSSDLDRTLADIRRKLEASDRAIKLGVDSKLVNAQLDELRARLTRLSRDDVDIRVRLNAGTALAELEALKRSTDGFGRSGIFARAKGSIVDTVGDLTQKLRGASPLIDGIAGKLSDLTSKIQGVGDSATAGVKNTPIVGLAASNIMVTAIAAALTTVGPLVAAASGGVLGLAGAAAAAGLAFKGLQTQMSLNVGYGRQLQTEFSGVMSIVDALGEAVADAIGPGLVSALGRVREALPSFGGLFKTVGSQLGDVAGSLSTALLDVFRNAAPVIVQVVGYIKQGAQRLAEWTGSEGFKQFLAYASRELPVVGGFVAALGKALISAFVAFAPVGEVVLRVLTGIANIAAGVFDAVGKVIDFFSGDASPKASGPASQIASLAAQLANLGQVTTTVANTSTGMAAVFGVTDGAFKAAADAAASTASQLAETTLQMRLQNDAAGLLKASLDALSGKNLGVAQTLTSFQQGLLGIDNTFTKAAFSSTAFTDAAVAQRSELQQLVTAAQAHAEAVGQQTGSTAAATAALQADYAQILANTGATGAQRDAINAYIQSIGAIPPVAPTKIDVNTAAATAQVAAFRQMYQNLPPGDVTISANLDTAAAQIQRFVQTPRTAYVQVSTVIAGQAPSGGRQAFAYGGVYDPVRAYARGGILDGLSVKARAAAARFARGSENHVPQIAMPNGGVRVWAEPETHGEAYIPFRQDSRARSEAILSDVAQRFGGAYMKPTAAAAAPAGGIAAALLGIGITLDLPSIGTLTGHIASVADDRIATSDAGKALTAGPTARANR